MDLTVTDMCFGCGKENECGLKLDITYKEGEAYASIIFKEHHQGWRGIVHGGIITAAIDEVMAYALGSMGIFPAVTAEINVRFKRPVKIGEKYQLYAQVIKSMGRKHILKGELKRNDVVYAFAEGIYVSLKNEVKS